MNTNEQAVETTPRAEINIKSFREVKDQGYELVYYGFGLGGDYYLRTAPADSPMRWIYDNQIKGIAIAFLTQKYQCNVFCFSSSDISGII